VYTGEVVIVGMENPVNRTLAAQRAVVPTMGAVLGILGSPPAAWLERRRDRLVQQRGLDRRRIEALIGERAEARKAKDFARADATRDELLALGPRPAGRRSHDLRHG